MKKRKNKSNKLFNLILIIFPVAIIIFASFKFFSPYGAIVRYEFSAKDDFEMVSPLSPIEKVNFLVRDGEKYLQIPEMVMSEDKITSILSLPIEEVKEARIKIRFKTNHPELKVGLRGADNQDYWYKAFWNKLLEELAWDRTEGDGIVFWQKYKNYDSVQELIDYPSSDQVVAQYLYDFYDNFTISDYVKSGETLIVDHQLRGSQILYTYIKDEVLDFTIEKQDRNGYTGEDILEIVVLRGGKEIYRVIVPDDGIADNSGNKKEPQIVNVRIPDLNEGIYEIKLISRSTGEDVLINKITTNQSLLAFEGRLFIVDEENPSTVWTNSRELEVETWHIEGFQTLEINDSDEVEIDKKKEIFKFTLDDGLNKIYSPKNDIIFSSDSYYSFSPDSFFNPKPCKTIELKEYVNLNDVDYIISDYNPSGSTKNNGWYEKEMIFDLSNMMIENGTLQFILWAPGLALNDREVIIDKIEITLKSPEVD